MLEDDYYDILNVPHDATIEVVRKSYKRLGLDAHPDKNRGNPSATAKFQRVSLSSSICLDRGMLTSKFRSFMLPTK